MRVLFLILFTLFANFFHGRLSASENPANDLTPNMDYGPEFLRMFVVLIILISFAVISAWFVKRLLKSRMRYYNNSKGIKILERRTLSPKVSLYLINVLGKGVVIAESPQGVQAITEVTLDKDSEFELINEVTASKPKFSFQEILNKKLKKANNPQP